MDGLTFTLVDGAAIDELPAPARPGARCQTCDYWERLEGSREGDDTAPRRAAKRAALMAGTRLAGSYGMVASLTDGSAVGYAQFGPLSAYPRAQLIRDRYPHLPESPAPCVITCLQVTPGTSNREDIGQALAEAVCAELDRRGVVAVETYLERSTDPWLPSGGPASVYDAAGFTRAAEDEQFPVYRRELAGETEVGWGDLLSKALPVDEGEDWPRPTPSGPREEDVFRLPPKPDRPNPFGDD
jgi:ribosomal protein S18 acetylase RimI-like enzyme